MNLPPRILFVGAHCDDIELIAGGLLARACFSGSRVGVLVFSDHRGVLDDRAAEQARSEFRSNLSWLRAESGAEITDHSTTMLPACQGAFQAQRGAIYAAMEGLRNDYPMVVTHPYSDTNQDHRQVAEEAMRVFKAHASVLAGEFPNNDIGGFTPQLYVELERREIDAKIKMVEQYRSQNFGGRPYLDAEVIGSLARLRGAQIRTAWAEAFAVAARVVIRHPINP